jgi:hypothetical protein
VPRQVDADRRARPGLAVDLEEAAVLRDDAVDRGEPQARPLALRLGGEEGLEEVRQGRRVHPAPGVADREPHVLPGDGLHVAGAVRLAQRVAAGLDGHPAGAVDRVAAVDAEVGEDLVELERVHADRPQPRAGLPLEGDALADEAPEHPEHARDALVQVEHHRRGGLLAR